MSKFKCLFCNNAAGSREHVFPGALGGRRVDKDIFCEPHNSAMGSSAAVLAEQLSLINARLRVVSDNSGAVRVHRVVDPESGIAFNISGRDISVAEPTVLKDEPTPEGRLVSMLFGSQKQVEEWMRTNRAAGLMIKIAGKNQEQHLFSKGFSLHMSMGGSEGLRSIAYVGLTYLAHLHSDLARAAELQAFREYVKTGVGQDFVWWEEAKLLPPGYPEEYRFQHRIAISMDEKTGVLSGHVDLFSTFSFGIKFGVVPGQTSFTEVIDINPIEENPPNDRTVKKVSGIGLFSYGTTAGTSKLSAEIQEGRAQSKMIALFAEIEEWHWEQEMASLVPKINGITSLPRTDWPRKIQDALQDQSQRLFNLINSIVTKFRQMQGHQPVGMLVVQLLAALIGAPPKPGISATPPKALIDNARTVIAAEIERILVSRGSVTDAEVRDLLTGVTGETAISKMMFKAIGVDIP